MRPRPRLYKDDQTRTTETIANLYKVAITKLQGRRDVRPFGQPLTKEATTAVLWLWFSRLEEDAAVALINGLAGEVEAMTAADVAAIEAARKAAEEVGEDPKATVRPRPVKGRKKPNPGNNSAGGKG